MLAARDDDESSTITFHSDFTSAGLKLMELPNKEVEEAIASGSAQLCFKAGRGESAVFCTETKTYNLRVADTSNTLYLSIPDPATEKGKAPACEVQGAVKEYFELEEIPPRVEQLTELLYKAPYSGALTEPDIDGKLKKSFEELSSDVQASPAELKTALRKLHAFEFEGCWRVLADDYLTEELSLERLSLQAVMKTIADHDVAEFVARILKLRSSLQLK